MQNSSSLLLSCWQLIWIGSFLFCSTLSTKFQFHIALNYDNSTVFLNTGYTGLWFEEINQLKSSLSWIYHLWTLTTQITSILKVNVGSITHEYSLKIRYNFNKEDGEKVVTYYYCCSDSVYSVSHYMGKNLEHTFRFFAFIVHFALCMQNNNWI